MKYRSLLLLATTLLAACPGKDDNNAARVADTNVAPDLGPDLGPDLADTTPDMLPDVPAEPGSLVVDPEALTFSDVRQGETASATIGLSNLGGSPIVVTGVQLVEFNRTGEPEFVRGPDWDDSLVLGPNIFKELTVVYEPKDFGVDQGHVEFFTNDPERDIVRVRIETVSAYAQLEGPGFLRFGDVDAGDSVTQRITFYNRGLDSLTINAVELGGITGTFAIAFEPTETPPTVLERDEDFVIDVTYTPDTQITHRGTITLTTDAPESPTFEVALVGNDPTPCLDISPDGVDFGEVGAGAPATQQVTLLNCSRILALDVSAITLTDSGDGAFTLGTVPTLPLQLQPLQTAQFPVSGVLAAPGVATGALDLTSTDTKSTGRVSLRLTVPEP